jgi:hypothetical protein
MCLIKGAFVGKDNFNLYMGFIPQLKTVTFILRCLYLLKDELKESFIPIIALTAYNIHFISCPVMDLHANSVGLHTAASGNVATEREREREIN